MYIIRTGSVQVLIEKEGKQIPITELGQGQYVGEMSFLTGVKRSADENQKRGEGKRDTECKSREPCSQPS